MTDILTVTIFALPPATGFTDTELICDFGRMIDALEFHGFHSDPISGTEEDDDCVIHSFTNATTGQIIDVTVWDEAPEGFSPINALPLEILA